MMGRSSVGGCVAVLGFLMLAGVGGAPAMADGFEIGFDIGYIDFDGDIARDSELRYDVRAGYFFNRSFQIELQLIRASGDLDTELTTVMINSVSSLRPQKTLDPYVLVGIGYAQLDLDTLDGTESFSDEDLAYQVGLGLRWDVGEVTGLGVRFEVSLLSEETFGGASNHVNALVGLTWQFGR